MPADPRHGDDRSASANEGERRRAPTSSSAGMSMTNETTPSDAMTGHQMSGMTMPPAGTTALPADGVRNGEKAEPMSGMNMGSKDNWSSAMPEHQMSDMPGMAMEQDKGTVSAHFFAIMILGVWLITSPFALNYGDTGLLWSDIISGALMIALAGVTLVRHPVWAPWANTLVGVWLLFAPLVFWSPTAGGYANDTLVGALLITFAILMPGMPGMNMLPGPDRPRGWSYNPSSWPQRAPIIALAFIGFILSRQMAAYQLGYTTSTWEPFFSPGTKAVLTSDVSKAFPISDAGFGGVAYMIEGLMGFMGGKDRWRTMPWMVTFFGILVVPLGIVSVGLIILQPVAVGAWCTPCLLAALAMLVMIALTLDEVVAMGQFLVQAQREGQSVWRVFWQGGALETPDPNDQSFHADVVSVKAMVWGTALPWNLIASIGLGLWLMTSPSALGYGAYAADSDHLIGALVVTVAIMALSDVGRSLRFVNVFFGVWFLAAPWILGGATMQSGVNDVVAGIVLIALSLPRGPVGERYGSWDPYIK